MTTLDRTDELRAVVNKAKGQGRLAILAYALSLLDAALSEEGSELNGSALRRAEDAKAVLLHLRVTLEREASP